MSASASFADRRLPLSRPDESEEVLRADLEVVGLGEHPAGGLADERLGVAQHAVHVEDDAEDSPLRSAHARDCLPAPPG